MKVSFCTLGCKVNQYESAAMAQYLASEGIEIVPFGQECDACIINTCAVTSEAQRKSCQMIRRASALSDGVFVAVTGCSAQLFPEKLKSAAKIDFITGNLNKMRTAEAVASFLAGKGASPQMSDGAQAFGSLKNFRDARFEPMSVAHCDRARAYIKIEDGCDHACSYCIIPHARGPVRSRPAENIVTEASSLSETGYSEIVLCGIEISAYGRDLGCDLCDLLSALERIPGIKRVRLGSLDPFILKKDFIDRLSKIGNLAPHLHLSLQSGCDRTLAAMKRRNTAESLYESVEYARKMIPDVSFTADVIVGFPGETDDDFAESASFIEKVGLLDFHIFAFSARPGTPAAEMGGKVDTATKKRREKCLEQIRERSKNAFLSRYIGRDIEVLFEEIKDGYLKGHTGNFSEVIIPVEEAKAHMGICAQAMRGMTLSARVKKIESGALYVTLCRKSSEDSILKQDDSAS